MNSEFWNWSKYLDLNLKKKYKLVLLKNGILIKNMIQLFVYEISVD